MAAFKPENVVVSEPIVLKPRIYETKQTIRERTLDEYFLVKDNKLPFDQANKAKYLNDFLESFDISEHDLKGNIYK